MDLDRKILVIPPPDLANRLCILFADPHIQGLEIELDGTWHLKLLRADHPDNRPLADGVRAWMELHLFQYFECVYAAHKPANITHLIDMRDERLVLWPSGRGMLRWRHVMFENSATFNWKPPYAPNSQAGSVDPAGSIAEPEAGGSLQ